MSYRVNFANGQVHYAGSLAQCERFNASYGDGFSYVEFQDTETSEWFKLRKRRRA